MGRIFRARDTKGNIVAIKEILPEFATDWSIIDRIEKEVKFLVRIDHPSIEKLYSAFRDEHTQCYYIVMELVEGLNIEQYVTRHGPIPEQQAVEMMMKYSTRCSAYTTHTSCTATSSRRTSWCALTAASACWTSA